MPGRFYSDLLKGVDDRLGVDWGKDNNVATDQGYLHPTAGDPFCDWKFTFKAQPKKEVCMEVSQTNEGEWKGAGAPRAETQKTAAKIKCDHGDLKSDWSFCNDKFTMNVSGDPINCNDYPSTVALNMECKPAKKEHKAKLLFDISTPDFSGVKFWQNLEVEYNQKKETLIRSKTNAQYESEYSVGAQVEHDTVDFRKIKAQVVCNPKDNDSTFWLRADAKREYVGAGCDNKLKDHIRHSWEALYCWTNGYKGIQGQPVKLLGGVHYELGSTSNLTMSAEAGESMVIKGGATHTLDKNWSVGVNQRFDSSKIAKDQNPYDIGFSMTYKL